MAGTVTLDVMHVSMQFSDSTRQKQGDAKRIFARADARGVSWITGTEAGLGAAEDLRQALTEEATKSGYRFVARSDLWIAVDKAMIAKGTYDTGFITTLPSSTGSQKFSTRGILWVQFKNAQLGTLSVGAGHYMTHGQKPGDEYYNANTKMTRALAEWGKEHGKGKKLVFYGGDQNIQDRENDTFRGAPFMSLADELKAHQNTGHGAIDVIASYNADTRVKGKYWRVLDDKEYFLNTDHFLCEGGFEVRPLKG
jgi:hypothetical protein